MATGAVKGGRGGGEEESDLCRQEEKDTRRCLSTRLL